MFICTADKNNYNLTLDFDIDHDKKDISFNVRFIESKKQYKKYTFKTLKAAYNKFDFFYDKYFK